MRRGNCLRLGALLVAGALTIVAAGSPAWASGVEILENGRGQAHSNAGVRVTADDASTVWWNAAGMARFSRHSVAVAGHLIVPQGDFVDEGSVRLPAPLLLPFTGEAGVTDEAVPAGGLFGVWSLTPQWKVGLGVNAPFGLVTDWGRSWIGRYYGTRSELITVNINPSVAYRFNRCWSVGAGVSLMYADAELGNAIDFGALLPVPAPQSADGHVTITGDSWGFGFNAGVLFEPTPCTRVGLHYRSRVEQEIEGEAEFEVPAAAAPIAAATGRFANTGASTEATFPDSLGLGVYHELNPCWAVMADVTWTGWSTFDELRIRFDNPAEPDVTLEWDWDDVWRFAVGATYRPNWCWAFRAGVAYDQSPIPDRTRSPRIPMNDRFWVSLGAGYRFNRWWSVDVHYTHIFMEDADINLASQAGGALVGHVEGSVDILGLQVNFDF